EASMPSEGKGDGPNGRATVHWTAADGNGTTITKYVVRWNGGSKTVDASTTEVAISGLKNGTSYRFTVEARNGFEADGGVSDKASAENSVRPYTKPAKPSSAKITTGKCKNANSCPVTFEASAGGGDGGAGDKMLQVNIDGEGWKDDGSSYSDKIQAKSGSCHSIEARVRTQPTNADGSSATMTSARATDSEKAQTYTPPKPRSDVSWGGYATNPNCTSQYCRRVDIQLSNLEPGKTYTLYIHTESSSYHPGGPWIDLGDGTPQVKADANGNYSTVAGGYDFLYGYPYNDFYIEVDGKRTSEHSYP